MIFQNALPIGLPLALVKCHFLSQMVFATYAVRDSTAAHSGYDFGRIPSPELHDKHHERPLGHYGILGFMDWLHGTNKPGLGKAQHTKWGVAVPQPIFRTPNSRHMHSTWSGGTLYGVNVADMVTLMRMDGYSFHVLDGHLAIRMVPYDDTHILCPFCLSAITTRDNLLSLLY